MTSDTTQPRRGKPWGITFFGLIAAGGLIAMPWVARLPEASKLPDVVRFIGHFHPALLHLPIGAFTLVVLVEFARMFAGSGASARWSTFGALCFAAAAATVAALAGFLLLRGGGYEGSALADRHMWGGLAFAAFAVLICIVKGWTDALDGNPAFFRLLLFLGAGVMTFASHDGASVTHGEGYMTEYAPQPLRGWLGIPPRKETAAKTQEKPAAERILFADVISPILERRCAQCHNATKSKGKLRMDSYELLCKGGAEGPAIEPGSAAKSRIIRRMALPKDNDDRMPPEGKTALDANELAVLTWWLDSGADPKKKVAEYDMPAPVKDAMAKLSPATTSSPADKTAAVSAAAPATTGATKPDAELAKQLDELSKAFPGALTFESQQSADVVFTAASMRGSLDDAGLGKLSPVFGHIVSADLSATKVTDRAVGLLAAAPSLRLLRLAETAVTDAAADELVKMKNLESLNLYGTQVTDAGAKKLADLPKLKHLYLWRTKVTPGCVEELKKKIPACEIVTGG